MLRLFFGRVLGDHFPIDAKKLHLGIHGKVTQTQKQDLISLELFVKNGTTLKT